MSHLKATMLRFDSAFDETNYGCHSYCGFLMRWLTGVQVVGRAGGDVTAALVGHLAGDVSGPGS